MVDPIGTIVVFADTSNVDSVFVAGRAVKRNGQLLDVDLGHLFQELDESRNHILSRGELLPDWAAEPGQRGGGGGGGGSGVSTTTGDVVVVGRHRRSWVASSPSRTPTTAATLS